MKYYDLRIHCRFDTEEVVGTVVNRNRAVCIQPFLMAEGYVIFDVAIGDEKFNWKGKYFVGKMISAGYTKHIIILSFFHIIYLICLFHISLQRLQPRLPNEFGSKTQRYEKESLKK